jgi:hypothetical protein
MNPFRSERLGNGIELAFTDRSNRYFGNYHRVCIEVRISVPPPAGPLQVIRQLDRMAVPGDEVAAVRDRLVGDFLRHAADYLGRAATPARLAAAAADRRLRIQQS